MNDHEILRLRSELIHVVRAEVIASWRATPQRAFGHRRPCG